MLTPIHYIVHLVLVFVMCWLTLVFVSGDHIFTSYAGFALMASVAPEQDWGIFTALVACVGGFGVLFSDWHIKIISAGLLSFGHLVIAGFIFLGKPDGTGTGAYLGYAILGAALAYTKAFYRSRLAESVEPSDPP